MYRNFLQNLIFETSNENKVIARNETINVKRTPKELLVQQAS